jgi:hypothetical protein
LTVLRKRAVEGGKKSPLVVSRRGRRRNLAVYWRAWARVGALERA